MLLAPLAVLTAPITGVLDLVRGTRDLLAERAERRLLKEPEAVSDAAQAAGPPWATAYRPSWVLPLRQSSIHVYVVMPAAQGLVDQTAHEALDAADNPAKRSHAIPLWRAPEAGELLTVGVELESFIIGRVEPIAWRPPYIRFVVPICAHVGVAIGIHRPCVSVRSAKGACEVLATFDFDLDVRAQTPRASRARIALVGGCAASALAVWTATAQHSLPPAVGWPAGAVCLAGGVRGAWPPRITMAPAETRDCTGQRRSPSALPQRGASVGIVPWYVAAPLDFERPETAQANQLLATAYGDRRAAIALAESVGVSLIHINLEQGTFDLMRDIMKRAAAEQRLERLLSAALSDPRIAAYHAQLVALMLPAIPA